MPKKRDQAVATYNALLYGDPKRGKTAAALMALPTALCIGNKSAIGRVGQEVLGFTPAVIDSPPRQLEALTQMIEDLSETWDGTYGGLIIDDVSLTLQQSMHEWALEGGSNTRYKFMALMNELNRFNNAARFFPGSIIQLYHENKPENGNVGGPQTPSRNRTGDSPPHSDFVARVYGDLDSIDPWWQNAFCVEPLGVWLSGSRLGTCWPDTPANLRAICYAGNGDYDLRRPRGLKWVDDLMLAMAAALDKSPPQSAADVIGVARSVATPFLSQDKTSEKVQVRWGLRDGLAVHIIKARRSASLFDLPAAPSAPSLSTAASPPPPPPRR